MTKIAELGWCGAVSRRPLRPVSIGVNSLAPTGGEGGQRPGAGEWDGEIASPFLILPTTVFQI
jgi:hypothetical protein